VISARPPFRLTLTEAVAFLGPPPARIVTLRANLPRGDGHTVLVLPAWLRGDPYTTVARGFLNGLGYNAQGWGLGVNVGPTRRLLDGSGRRLVALSDRYGPISIVGFSMGGLFARRLAQKMPDRVRQIITVCSPIIEPDRNFWLPLRAMIRLWPDIDLRSLATEIAGSVPVPATILFSRDDGLVNFSSCRDDAAGTENNLEIAGPHVLIARNADVMRIMAERLAKATTA
jgi:pimeloyl-ACP methyl ester carboxylesterase